jgi:SHS2 domain-containing protein
MERYEYIPHTSDEQFKAYGKSLEEAFKNAAYAMFDIVTDHTEVDEEIEKHFSIKSEDKESLLYDFLEEFLYYLDSEQFLLSTINELSIKDNAIIAHFVGDNRIHKYDINTHIKAVTYQNMIVSKKDETYVVQVVVDI